MAYRDAVNASDVDGVLELYASDAVLMAQESPPSVGAAAIRSAYVAIFEAVALTIDFKIAEVHQLAPDWAFARTTSSGTIVVKAAGINVPEGNQELFLFEQVAGIWKIARYSFSTTSPAQS